MKYTLTIFSLFILSFIACESPDSVSTAQASLGSIIQAAPDDKSFSAYWYAGKAELSSYTLKQARYGEMRDGEVVLIFVTEPFSASKQVKLDYADKAGKDKIPVMKLNQVRKFKTGIYDYSVLTSTFTPIDVKNHPRTIKSTTSMQEWCGHTYTQLNLAGSKYKLKQFSYFESEGDDEAQIEAAMLEDELLSRIRISGGNLPEGEIDLIPSTLSSRFSHKNLKAGKATVSKTTENGSLNYTIKYSNIERTVTIEAEEQFPHKILGWTEDDGSGQITTARLKASSNEPYWGQKSVVDEGKRKALKLLF